MPSKKNYDSSSSEGSESSENESVEEETEPSDLSDNESKKKRVRKNIVYKKEQLEIYEKIKKIVKYDKSRNCFTDFDVEENRKELMALLPKIKKYFHTPVWNFADKNPKKTSAPLSLIRCISKLYGNCLVKRAVKGGKENFIIYINKL